MQLYTPIPPLSPWSSLQVAPQIATLGEGGYRKALMEHLVDRKLAHQDTANPKKIQGWIQAEPPKMVVVLVRESHQKCPSRFRFRTIFFFAQMEWMDKMDGSAKTGNYIGSTPPHPG